jgi:HlyD family secretion protein
VHKTFAFYLALLGIVGSIALVYYLRQEPPAPPIHSLPARNPYHRSIAASGIIEAVGDNIEIGVPVPGIVREVDVKVSDEVLPGQVLFRLDQRELEAQLIVQKAEIQTAEASLHRLKDRLDRLKSVGDPRAVSREEVQTRENDVRVAEKELAASRARVEQTLMLMERLIIRSPIQGTVLQCNVRPGEYVNLNSQVPPILLGDMDQLQVRVQIDEQNASRAQPGQPAMAYLKGRSDSPIPLQFVRIEPYVVPKKTLTGDSSERVDTRVLEVIYAFEKPANLKVYVGQIVDVFISMYLPEEKKPSSSPPS